MNEYQAQELEQERALSLLMALDECKARGVSKESLRLLVYETGAGALVGKFFLEKGPEWKSKAE